MAKKSKAKTKKRIAAKPKNIQKRVRDLTLEAISKRNLSLDHLSDRANAVLGSATSAMKNVLPTSRKSVLKQVLNGIDDAWAATARASVASVKHAQQFGLRLAKQDLTHLGKRLGSLEQEFIKTIDVHAKRLGGDLGNELTSLTKQVRKAGTQIRPAAEAARKAITDHGATLAKEVAQVGAKAGKQALRSALLTAGGLLEGAGKGLRASANKKRRTK